MRAVAVGVDAYLAQKLPRTLSDPTTSDPHGSRLNGYKCAFVDTPLNCLGGWVGRKIARL